MLTLIDISKSYGTTQALQPTDLDIAAGRTTVLIGPSGCGKSTLLRLMIGLIRPDAGRILFDGTELTRENVRDMRQRMGYVIQDGGLFPHLTSRENVELMARYLGWDENRRKERLQEMVELTQLWPEVLDRYPVELSGGQQQRVSLMRALMLDPDVLLLDEPLGALDPVIRYEMQQELREIFRRLEKTVVMVTHDMGEAGFFGDTIVLLRDGAILQKGSLEDLLQRPADPFIRTFIQAQRSPLESLQQETA
ncbi:MAG: ATP-binding cassette domain-containing protein [Desulfuromonadales bacterium]